jgi:hypothetical protein
MVANTQGDLYYKVMAMAMEGIGEGVDELWWWISSDEWWIDLMVATLFGGGWCLEWAPLLHRIYCV